MVNATVEGVDGCRDQQGTAMSRIERNPPFIWFFFVSTLLFLSKPNSVVCVGERKKDRLGFQPVTSAPVEATGVGGLRALGLS